MVTAVADSTTKKCCGGGGGGCGSDDVEQGGGKEICCSGGGGGIGGTSGGGGGGGGGGACVDQGHKNGCCDAGGGKGGCCRKGSGRDDDEKPTEHDRPSCCTSGGKVIVKDTSGGTASSSCCGETTSSCCQAPSTTIMAVASKEEDNNNKACTFEDEDDDDSNNCCSAAGGGGGGGDSLCLAVIRENGADVVVFDASGTPRPFRLRGGGAVAGGARNVRDLCFDTHDRCGDRDRGDGGGSDDDGSDDLGIGELLTPCFDGNGNHGEPEESCFCGVDTPHLHAHVRDPKRCGGGDGEHRPDGAETSTQSGCKNTKASSRASSMVDIGFLASQILYPVDDASSLGGGTATTTTTDATADEEERDDSVAVLHLEATDSMPTECNAKFVKDYDRATCSASALNRCRARKVLHKVKHDGHYDYLVHNRHTNELRLEHPCTECGGSYDVHGTFRSVAERRVVRPQQRQRERQSKRGGRRGDTLRVQFFEVGPRPAFGGAGMNILEHLHNMFEPKSCDRVNVVERMMEDITTAETTNAAEKDAAAAVVVPSVDAAAAAAASPSPRSATAPRVVTGQANSQKKDAVGGIVRSTLYCDEICCPTEEDNIMSILSECVPSGGIHSVRVNVALKRILIEHEPKFVTADAMARILTQNNFVSRVGYDGGIHNTNQKEEEEANTVGRSAFYVQGICCASEIPAIHAILGPLVGIQDIKVNTTSKLLYVDHIIGDGTVTAQDICNALNGESFGAEIRNDAAKAILAAQQSSYVRSVLEILSNHEDDEALARGGGSNRVEDQVDRDDDLERTVRGFLDTFEASQVESFTVDVRDGKMIVAIVHNPFVISIATLVDAIEEGTGFKATVLTDGADPKSWCLGLDDPATGGNKSSTASGGENLDEDEKRTYPKLTVVISGVCWIISMLTYVGGNWEYLKYVGLVSVVIGIPNILIKALRTMRRYQFDANCLMTFAAIGACALQEYPEAAAVVFLFSISEYLEKRASSRARRALAAIIHLRPEKANLVHPSTKELVVVPASRVPVGALVVVKSGDQVPCDGLVVDGQTTVDESSLTGESRPIRKGVGDEVSGGTVNSGLGSLTVQVTSTAENSAVSKLIRLVEEAQANKSATEKLVDEFAKYYTPIIVLAALLMVSIPWAFGKDVGLTWTNNGLVLIVVACPCALIISTPVAYVAGLAATARRGILVKSGAHLEALGLVKHICFDKTGTLTNGRFALLNLELTTNNTTRIKAFQYLSAMEEHASHPLASAILAGAKNEGVTIPRGLLVTEHTIIAGEGVAGIINGLKVHVGNERMFTRLGLMESVSDRDQRMVKEWKEIGGTIGYMSIESYGIVCAFCAADSVRPEAAEVLCRLRKRGIETVMLTGDNRDAALAIGRQVGLHENQVISKLLPEEKLQYVDGLSRGDKVFSILCNPCSTKRLVLMCGDGVNDAPALACADIGVAMGQGATLAMETADVTLLDSNLSKLEYSIVIGRRVIDKIKQNVVFSIVVKFVVLGFALAGKTNLWAAIGSDVGAMLLVTLNAMMLLPSRQRASDVQKLKGDIESPDLQHHDHDTSAGVKGSSRACDKGCCEQKNEATNSVKDFCNKSGTSMALVSNEIPPKPGCCSRNARLVREDSGPGVCSSGSDGRCTKMQASKKSCCNDGKCSDM